MTDPATMAVAGLLFLAVAVGALHAGWLRPETFIAALAGMAGGALVIVQLFGRY